MSDHESSRNKLLPLVTQKYIYRPKLRLFLLSSWCFFTHTGTTRLQSGINIRENCEQLGFSAHFLLMETGFVVQGPKCATQYVHPFGLPVSVKAGAELHSVGALRVNIEQSINLPMILFEWVLFTEIYHHHAKPIKANSLTSLILCSNTNWMDCQIKLNFNRSIMI